MRLTTFLMIVSFLTSACAKLTPESSPYPMETKNLHSVWSNQTDTFDLSKSGEQAPPPVKFTFPGGAVCQTDLAILGQDTVGALTITTSVYMGGGSSDPECASFIGNYTYENPTGFALILCNSSAVCSTYQ